MTEEGASYGYSPFLRHGAAEAGDVLVANFDSSSSEVDLEISDTNAIEDSEDLRDE